MGFDNSDSDWVTDTSAAGWLHVGTVTLAREYLLKAHLFAPDHRSCRWTNRYEHKLFIHANVSRA